jgi:hypothetical protein
MISERDLPVLHSRSTASPQLDRSILPRMYPGFAPAWWRDFPAIWHRFCTGSSPTYPQVIHRVIQPITPDPYTAYPPVPSPRGPRRSRTGHGSLRMTRSALWPGGAGDAAAGVGAAAGGRGPLRGVREATVAPAIEAAKFADTLSSSPSGQGAFRRRRLW